MDTNQRGCSIHKIVGVGLILPFPHQTKQVVIDFTSTHNDLMGSICHKRNRFPGENEVILESTMITKHSQHFLHFEGYFWLPPQRERIAVHDQAIQKHRGFPSNLSHTPCLPIHVADEASAPSPGFAGITWLCRYFSASNTV